MLDEDNRLSLSLRNGSRVVRLPGTAATIRGFSAPDLIIEDEAAFVDDGFYRATRPMLATTSGGRLILMSTPYGKRGHFYEAWHESGDWHRVEVPATDCPRITPAIAELVDGGDLLHLRHLERLPLGLPYPEAVEQIGALVRALLGEADLVIDATGVGRPVLDMLRAAGLEPVAVTITGGRSASFDGGTWRVPKRMLVRALATAFEAGRLKVARSLPSAGALLAELQAFRRQISQRGHDSYAGAGEHDDLVIATALACWWPEAERRLARADFVKATR